MAKIRLKIFIGWDPNEEPNYQACVHSIRKHATIPIEVIPLVQDNLRKAKIYTRPHDDRASNQFSITRFLVPYLSSYKGYSLFMDCDMAFTRCPGEVLRYCNKDHALTVVKHDYVPKESVKFLGQKQEAYPRKNWSSFCMWNCSHKLTTQITPDLVNKATPAFLHRFEHFPNETIGAFPTEMNWLVGEYGIMDGGLPFNLHWTLGSPQFDGYEGCDYSDLWNQLNTEAQAGSVKNRSVLVYKNTKDIIEGVQEREKLKNSGCGC